jgi:hypothetical protein
MTMDSLPAHDDAKHNGSGMGAWSELKPAATDMRVPCGLDHIDGPTFAQAPVLFIDGDAEASLKADSADLLALKSASAHHRSSEPTSASPGAINPNANPTTDGNSFNANNDTNTNNGNGANVAFSSFELSYVPPPHEAVPVGVSQYAAPATHANPQYAPRLSLPVDQVGAFLQSLTLTFSTNAASVEYLRGRLGEMGYDSIIALAFVTDHEMAMAGIAFPQDQHMIRSCAHQEFAARRPHGPPNLYQMVTMSKWLMQCGIPRQMATVYTTQLQTFGYDNVQHFDSIGHDSRALGVFRPGHYHLFKYFLERVLQQQQQHPQQVAGQGYNAYYNTSTTSATRRTADDFNPTLLDDLVPSGFPNPTTSMYQQGANANVGGGYYQPPPTANANNNAMLHNAASSFTDMMHHDASSMALPTTSVNTNPTTAGPYLRPMAESDLRLLYEAVNMDDKTNPCRRGKKVDWTVIATNGMGDPRFAVLAQYTSDELERHYVRHHELPLHTNARNSDWSSELIKLLWKVSQDTRCKNGTKTMWEQIANGRTGVAEYQPLAKFSNSQLRSRFRTEFGDKRPQSRKRARETKNALAKAAALGLAGGSAAQADGADTKSAAQLKIAAKQKAAAAKARKSIHDEHRTGLGDGGGSLPPGSSGVAMAI